VLSPEFKPPFHGFGQTLILGSYDGALLLVCYIQSEGTEEEEKKLTLEKKTAFSEISNKNKFSGAINFVEFMASAHWLSANAALGKRLCFPIIGSPKEYRYGK